MRSVAVGLVAPCAAGACSSFGEAPAGDDAGSDSAAAVDAPLPDPAGDGGTVDAPAPDARPTI